MSDARITRQGVIALAVDQAGVKPATVRQWIARGVIQTHPDGFDPDEVLTWITTIRNTEKAIGAAVGSHNRYTARRAS